MADERRPVLAVDPGRDKCGIAVVYPDGKVAQRGIVPSSELARRAVDWRGLWNISTVVLGTGTGSRPALAALRAAQLDPILVEETGTTFRARELYFRKHPPRGWRRLIPRLLQTPPVPLDDYAAVLIADNYFRQLATRAGEG